LKFGELHPRTLLADLQEDLLSGAARRAGAAAFHRELAWREFSADQLWHHPDAARSDLRAALRGLRMDAPGPRLRAWEQGRTGFPLVDAGMRQLLAEGWMHNRARMVVASFLVKDLHLPCQLGARWFMRQLRDGDLASNSLNWQRVAGSGSDAAPYVRIFNPVTQGLRFDPAGRYVRRHVPELEHLPGAAVHLPWDAADGYAHGYPQRIVDHATERTRALARLAQAHRPGGPDL
jgi:deoxyribodipyrimidine photo-lyase